MRILLLLLASSVPAAAQTWETDLDRALRRAKKQSKPVLVYAYDAY